MEHLLLLMVLVAASSTPLAPPDGVDKRSPEGQEVQVREARSGSSRQSKMAPAFVDNMDKRSPEVSMYGHPLNPEDFEAGAKLTEKDIVYPGKVDPSQKSGLFEGDIRKSELSSRNGITEERALWPGGQIPYAISTVFDERDRSVIARAISEYHEKTCIRFVPRTDQVNYVYFNRGQGCFSMIGMTGGRQDVSLGNGCVYVGIVVHELMHATGFFHEQSRADRDDYIDVMWRNIVQGMEFNFQKQSLGTIDHLGEKYDYSSIMHYGPTSFSNDGMSPTIVPKEQGATIGQRQGFSQIDINKINKLYKCGTQPKPKPEPEDKDKNEIGTGSGPCKDSHEFCSAWSVEGECLKNPDWMLENCKLSCQQCDGAGEVCEDDNDYCNYWADKNECGKNPRYMLIKCKKSCAACKGSCKDQHKKCGDWAREGHCGKHGSYMRNVCRKSCQMC